MSVVFRGRQQGSVNPKGYINNGVRQSVIRAVGWGGGCAGRTFYLTDPCSKSIFRQPESALHHAAGFEPETGDGYVPTVAQTHLVIRLFCTHRSSVSL